MRKSPTAVRRFLHPIHITTSCHRCDAPAVYTYLTAYNRYQKNGSGRIHHEEFLCPTHAAVIVKKYHVRVPQDCPLVLCKDPSTTGAGRGEEDPDG